MVAQEDFNQARLVAEQSIRNFLLEWANLNVLCDKLRLAKLEKMRILSELFTTVGQFFLTSNIDQTTFERATKFYGLALPSTSDSTIFWDTLITYRTFFCRKLIDRTMDDDLDSLKVKLTKTVETEQMRLFNVGLEQGNVGLATNILDRIRTECDLMQINLLDSYLLIKTAEDKVDVTERLNELEFARERLVSLEGLAPADRTQITIKVPLSLAEIGEMLLLIPENERNHKIFKEYTGLTATTTADVQEKVISYLKTAIERSHDETTNIGDCYMKYADFASVCLEIPNSGNKVVLQTDIVRYTLRAMQLGHRRARELFPRLLQLPGLHEESISNTFSAEAFSVPDWLFLEWIPQILCHTNLHVECCLDVIVTKLFTSYPSALIYPLRFTLMSTLEDGEHARPFLTNILNNLETPLIKNFINGLLLICYPLLKMKLAVTNLWKLLENRPQNKVFHSFVKKEMRNLFDNVENQGSEYRKCRKYEKYFNDLLKMDGKPINYSLLSF